MHIVDKSKEIAEFIKRQDNFHIIAHLDADGISAGAIAVKTLERLGKEFDVDFVKQVDQDTLRNILKKNMDVLWFVDLSINVDLNFDNVIVTDHHRSMKRFRYSLNPNDFGFDGGTELSGAGATYLVARSISRDNMDLSYLAVVGACGDLQDRRNRKLVSINRDILRDSVKINLIDIIKDIQYFGRESKPLFRLLFYADDPVIPGVSGSEEACIAFLLDLGFNRRDIYRRWVDLDRNKKRKILSEIARRLLGRGFGATFVRRLIGEVYILKNEKEGTELHDAREFATLLNSTARYGRPDIALKICLGEREKYLKEARRFLDNHRQNLSSSLQIARSRVERRKYLCYFHAENKIKDTIVGSVTSMLSREFSSHPIVGFANGDNGNVKVSARYRGKGIDLSRAIYTAALSVGGTGGGHRRAAGALIPRGTEEEFLDMLEKEIRNQLSLEVL